MNENQVFFHLFILQPHYKSLYDASQAKANENVWFSQVKIWKDIVQTYCKFKVIWIKLINKSVINFFVIYGTIKLIFQVLHPPLKKGEGSRTVGMLWV